MPEPDAPALKIDEPKNVLGGQLEICCLSPKTGFYRTGHCHTGPDDHGVHTVCVQATEEFLEYSRSVGNDLSTPNAMFDFPGVKPGDKWCLCASRWKEAYDAGMAPPVFLAATHQKTLEHVSMEELLEHALDVS